MLLDRSYVEDPSSEGPRLTIRRVRLLRVVFVERKREVRRRARSDDVGVAARHAGQCSTVVAEVQDSEEEGICETRGSIVR